MARIKQQNAQSTSDAGERLSSLKKILLLIGDEEKQDEAQRLDKERCSKAARDEARQREIRNKQ